jgi:hypothetical protein
MNDNALKFSVDAERLSKLGTYFLQSKEGQDAISSGSLKGPDANQATQPLTFIFCKKAKLN